VIFLSKEKIRKGIDLKALKVYMFNSILESFKSGEFEGITVGKDTKTLLITNFGVVEGTIRKIGDYEESNLSQVFFSSVTSSMLKAANEEMSKLEEDRDITEINQSTMIYLTDVLISPFDNPRSKTQLDNLLLFSDQVVGVSAGRMS
jgi:hypothetical protein